MKDSDRKKRNAEKLMECHPGFRDRLVNVIRQLEDEGYRPRIQDAWRSPDDQYKAFASGHSKLKWGFHNVTGKNGEKESLAVDLIDDDTPLASGAEYCVALARAADDNKLQTGILWGLTTPLADAVKEAINSLGEVPPKLKIGWDPTHVEPSDITPQEAKAGKRPWVTAPVQK